MPATYEERAAKTAKRALRLLDEERIYNHLYVIGADRSQAPYKAQDMMSALWELLYSTIRVGSEDADRGSQLNELRTLGRTYLDTPWLHSARVRNLLVEQMFNVAYPEPRGISIPDKAILPALIGLYAITWFPGVDALLRYTFGLAAIIVIGWWLVTRRKRNLTAHLRDELSTEFNDQVIRSQLESLDSKRHRLPTIIFDLIDQKPPTYSRVDLDKYINSVPVEQWREGMSLKSEWQKRIYQAYRPADTPSS